MNSLVPFVQKPEQFEGGLRISELLQRFLEEHQEEEVSLRDLMDTLGGRSFGPTILLCALPEALPIPLPGISFLVSLPLMLVSSQLLLGYKQPWLPHQMLDQSFKRDICEQVIAVAVPFLEKLEGHFEPRWSAFTGPEAERFVGGMLLLLSFIIALPIPFGNMLPAIVIVLICLGLIEEDGLIIAVSAMITGVTPALLLLLL